jgi:aromatic ring-opening dioxygenase LigB subunit
MAVVTASSAAGALDDAAIPVRVACAVDRDLALATAAAIDEASIPVVEVSYGGNDPAEAVMPLDWGAAIPLWHILAHAPSVRTVIVSPARDLDPQAHVRAGAAIAAAARSCGRRIAVVASADQGHGHTAEGRYGFRAESAVFDQRVAAMVREGRLDDLMSIREAEVDEAIADSWWQMLMLLGALREDVPSYDCELLAYEAPTYYGMLTAVVTPRARPRASMPV